MIQLDHSLNRYFPELRLAYIVHRGAGGHASEAAKNRLFAECEKGRVRWSPVEPSQILEIRKWRERFRKFPTPKGAASSIENLIRRVRSGKFPPSISPLVDFSNAISLKYGIPMGGEDLKKLELIQSGKLTLKASLGTEVFRPLGSPKNSKEAPDEYPLLGEIIYADDRGAVCRALNWRESERTCIGDSTADAIFVTEVFDEDEAQIAKVALMELGVVLKEYCGGDFDFGVVSEIGVCL